MAAAFGYYVYLVRAAKPYRPAQLYRLNEAGEHAQDLLSEIKRHIEALGSGYHSQAGSGEGYRVREVKTRGRTLWVRVNRGPEGVPGETWDRDNNVGVDTTDRIALLSGLRAMFALPADSYYGLLFVEKVGARNLKDLLTQIGARPASQTTGVQIRLESFAELSDWERELENFSALRISETLAVRASGEDASTATDAVVHITADGSAVKRATDRVKDVFFSRVSRRDERLDVMQRTSDRAERRIAADADGVAFQEEDEYQADLARLRELNQADVYEPELGDVVSSIVPVDRSTARHQSFDVALGDVKPRRSISIEGSAIPLFKYELGGRLTDRVLRETWVAHAESILKNRGVRLPQDWATRRTVKNK